MTGGNARNSHWHQIQRNLFLEDPKEQVRYCKVCYKPILLADWIKSKETLGRTRKASSKSQWHKVKVCIPPFGEHSNWENNPCGVISNQWNKHNIRWRETFDRAEAINEFRILREAYGFDEADTESTFSIWDLVKIDSLIRWEQHPSVDINRLSRDVIDTHENIRRFGDYFYNSSYGLEKLDGYVDVLETNFRFVRRTPRKCKQRLAKRGGATRMFRPETLTIWYFFAVFKTMFPNEWKEVPLWAFNVKTRKALYDWGVIDEWRWEIDGKKNSQFFSGLFDKMLEEWYPNGVSPDDYSSNYSGNRDGASLVSHIYRMRNPSLYAIEEQDFWFPTSALFYQKSQYEYKITGVKPIFTDSFWSFVEMFQRYVKRKSDGTFGKFDCSKLEFKMYSAPDGRPAMTKDLITHKDCLNWFWLYLIPFFGIEIEDKENFPYNTPTNELLQLINIDLEAGQQVPGFWAMTRALTKMAFGKRHTSPSMENIIRALYPNYEFDMVLWTTQSTKGESKMNQILLKVMTWAGFDWSFSNAEYIPTLEGGFAKYWDTKAHMKIDGISLLLGVIAEAQGIFHYVFDPEDEWLKDGKTYSRKVPDAYRGKDRTILGYRQNRDRLCRKAIIRNGFTPVYVILTDGAYPVKGVHGDIPRWNYSYVTAENSRGRIGLAETFDMQGRKDIGDMIRDYYYNVVLNEEE